LGKNESGYLRYAGAHMVYPATLFSARPISPYFRTASEQDERWDEISKTLRADLKLAGLNVTANHTRFGRLGKT
jgi:hypothetical protein